MAHSSHKQEQLALIMARKLLEELATADTLTVADITKRAQTILRHFPNNGKIDLLYRSLKPT
jgi:hypothetical protein